LRIEPALKKRFRTSRQAEKKKTKRQKKKNGCKTKFWAPGRKAKEIQPEKTANGRAVKKQL